jgi:hypothetical protein
MKDKIKDIAVRTVKTMAETALATIGTAVLIESVNWVAVLSATALSGVCCVLFNISKLK